MAVNAYLNFNGNCREALAFYADVFHTKLPKITTYGDQANGYPMPDAMKALVMHAEMRIMGDTVMFSDVPGDMPFTIGNNVRLTLISDDAEALQSAFAKMKAGGEVLMDLQPTFWSSLYGYVVDRFGVGWQISHETAKQTSDRLAQLAAESEMET